MLFNSFEFILFFLPVTLFVFFVLHRTGQYTGSVLWLIIASLFFYGWWNPSYLALIVVSIAVNFYIGELLAQDKSVFVKKALLTSGILFNLALLGYFKYANFIVSNLNDIIETSYHLEKIILPLAISFFTFQQIAYLVDSYQNKVRHSGFMHYVLFVTFFPQLIAGPIVHHKEMLPQFTNRKVFCFRLDNLAIGMTIFIIGLFKKVVIADTMALYATPVFDSAAQGATLSIMEAWTGTMAYTFQLYFDFSGYSDMAIGAARMFGIRLPLNFNSPYKSVNIVQFWRNWHITLSQFLKYYVYIPLGGNRKGPSRRYVNLMLTMLLGGLWHGAGWTFVVWGGLHGFYLVVNHMWLTVKARLLPDRKPTAAGNFVARMITLVAVAVSWVFFRAENFTSAVSILKSMFALQAPTTLSQAPSVHYDAPALMMLFIALIICWYFPNTKQIMQNYKPVYKARAHSDFNTANSAFWRPTSGWAVVSGFIIAMGLFSLYNESEFLYFQF